MNLIEMTVTEVLSAPIQYQDKDLWMVDVMADGWGRILKTTVMKTSKAEAEKVSIGYRFEG